MTEVRNQLDALLERLQKEAKALAEAILLPFDQCIPPSDDGDTILTSVSAHHRHLGGQPKPVVEVTFFVYRSHVGVWRETKGVRKMLRRLAQALVVAYLPRKAGTTFPTTEGIGSTFNIRAVHRSTYAIDTTVTHYASSIV